MTTRFHCIVLALLSLLVLATSASAAGAWMLRSVDAEMDPSMPIARMQHFFYPTRWQPTTAYDKASACTAALNQAE